MMQLEANKRDGILVVSVLAARLAADNSQAFKEALERHIDQGNRRVILDLAPVRFIDSSGLGAIVEVLRRLSGQGELAICCAEEGVHNLFKLTRMDKVLRIFETETEAVQALAVPAQDSSSV
jgi:anti-sigma B factor antagonist